MSKKTVRKTSGRVKDALIKAGPEKSEIQAELNQDFPGRYKLITAVVLGTMAASAGAVTSATINVASPGSGTVAVTTTDDNIVVSGTDTLSIGLASNVTGLRSIAATTVTGTTVNVGGVALTADGNGGISVAGITSSETISGGTLKVGESDTWSSAGGLAVSGNITTSTGTVKGATVQAGDNITLSGSTGGISGTTLTTTGNITTSTGDISAYGDVKGATVHVGNIALSTGDSSELSVSTGITAGGDISAGTNTVTGGTFQISGQGTANQWTSSLLTAAAVTSTGNLTVGDNKLTVTAASGDVASAGKVEAAGNVVAGNGGSYTVTLSAEDGSVTASGNITAGANGTIGFTNSNTNKWTNADGLTASIEELDRRDVISKAILAQPGAYAWVLWNDKIGSVSNTVKEHANEYDVFTKQGIMKTCDDLKCIAEFTKIPYDSLKGTIDRVDSMTGKGNDKDFHHRAGLVDMSQGKYYVIKAVPSVHHTMGGVRINEKAQALDAKGKVIPGLWAAGEVTGVTHGTNRLGGNAYADIIVFGRIAGKAAAEAAK